MARLPPETRSTAAGIPDRCFRAKYYGALTPTPEKPVTSPPSFERLLRDVEGVIVKPPLGMQAFWGTKGAWGVPSPSAGKAVLGDASDIYVSEVTRDQAGQLLARLSPTAGLPA
jgi:hypothetical protein